MTTTDRQTVRLVRDQPEPVRQPETPQDAERWLTVTMIELAKRFLGMAAAAGFTEAKQRHECPQCGQTWKG